VSTSRSSFSLHGATTKVHQDRHTQRLDSYVVSTNRRLCSLKRSSLDLRGLAKYEFVKARWIRFSFVENEKSIGPLIDDRNRNSKNKEHQTMVVLVWSNKIPLVVLLVVRSKKSVALDWNVAV